MHLLFIMLHVISLHLDNLVLCGFLVSFAASLRNIKIITVDRMDHNYISYYSTLTIATFHTWGDLLFSDFL